MLSKFGQAAVGGYKALNQFDRKYVGGPMRNAFGSINSASASQFTKYGSKPLMGMAGWAGLDVAGAGFVGHATYDNTKHGNYTSHMATHMAGGMVDALAFLNPYTGMALLGASLLGMDTPGTMVTEKMGSIIEERKYGKTQRVSQNRRTMEATSRQLSTLQSAGGNMLGTEAELMHN